MSEGIVRIHGKEYRTVGKRIADFRADKPDYEISTEVLSAAELVLVKATIKDPDGKVIATGHAEELRGSTNINKTSALENAETSAVGRCLAFLGMGGTEIASADEVVNAQKQSTEKDIYSRMVQFTKAMIDNYSSVIAIQTHIANDEADLAREAWAELDEYDQRALWLATTKGGCFTTQEREYIKNGFKGA
jgi:hypothetical protein